MELVLLFNEAMKGSNNIMVWIFIPNVTCRLLIFGTWCNFEPLYCLYQNFMTSPWLQVNLLFKYKYLLQSLTVLWKKFEIFSTPGASLRRYMKSQRGKRGPERPLWKHFTKKSMKSYFLRRKWLWCIKLTNFFHYIKMHVKLQKSLNLDLGPVCLFLAQ